MAIHGVMLLASNTVDNINSQLASLQSALGYSITVGSQSLRCRFDFPAMVSHLGPNFAFHDNDYQFSPDKLKKLFPPWHGDEGWLPSLKKAGDRAGIPFKCPLRGPITKDHMRAVRTGLDLSTGFGAAVWAGATTLFWGCYRAGDLTIKSARKFDPQHNTCRETRTSFTNVNRREVVNFHIAFQVMPAASLSFGLRVTQDSTQGSIELKLHYL
ncbi:hypothetical protein B0H14DRAFT_3470780 [Mycena olivaceomarginata]|nr:hypothetical protein B0H14DRAFT_3470780 [Mycena olivaceomarginata]